MRIKNSTFYIIIAIPVVAVILYIIFSSPGIMSFFDGLVTVMYDFVVNNPISAYFGAFLISTIGNFTVFLPVPYALAVFLLGAQPFINPLLLALICGLGSGIGEVSAYLIGLGGRKFIEKKYAKNLKSISALIERYGFWGIVLFAATPLPDDTLLITLGVLKYNIVKTLVACTIGKIMLCAILAFGGRLGWGFVELIFTGGGVIGTVLAIIGTILLIYFMLKIDWSNILNRNKEAEDVEKTEAESK
ncbi:MAG: VTT domain-containing protein [Candidatus Odinarchaeum yellowstonii]|uniref:VTT domain-containing protein n=1 Tax=Odinarchaeota yellowstonii (strain LCB_4) TaxID=1841599 RepID=A0AAF0D1L3_ODILC|nr:MAG: VTT domain-containing protein [Candidatus Odinarchaeum yellowstonii]